MAIPWSRLAFAAVLLLALKFHLSQILDPWKFNGDARQHVFWTYRFADPELFPGDPLVRFISSPRFDPPGYVAFYSVGARLLDPLLFSKLLAAGLCLVTGWCAFRAGRRLGGPAAGLLAAGLAGVLVFDDHRGGLPRSFAWPLLFFFLDALVHRRLVPCGLGFTAAALFYPPLVVSLGALLPLLFLDGGRLRLPPWRPLLLQLGLPLLVAAAIVASSYLLVEREFTGPMVTRDESFAMPEFHRGGRNEFWDPPPVVFSAGSWKLPLADLVGAPAASAVSFWLGDWSYNRSSCGLFSKSVFWPFVLCAALLAVRRRRFVVPRELAWLLGSSLLLFLAAHAVLWKLFQPSRYTLFAWPAAFALLAAVNLAPLLERPLEAVRRALAGGRGAVVFALLLAAVAAGGASSRSNAPPPSRIRFYEAVSALPKDVLLAGWPGDLDNVPLRARRSVLVNRELSLPYYKTYYALVRDRTEASLRILTARDRETLLAAARRHGVTHVVVVKSRNEALRRGDPGLVDPPFDAVLRRFQEEPGVPLLARPDHGFPVVHEDEDRILVAMP